MTFRNSSAGAEQHGDTGYSEDKAEDKVRERSEGDVESLVGVL